MRASEGETPVWRRHGRAILVVTTAFACLLGGTPARAGCLPGRDRIIWSYPAEGATGVPTNARIFILTGAGLSYGDITVNGHPFRRDPRDLSPGWNPTLAPSTTYRVVQAGHPDDLVLT